MKPCLTMLLTMTVFLLVPPNATPADGDGGYAGAFYQIPIGARPTAMGGAYLALSDDGAAPRYNPAGIVVIDHKLFATSYRLLELDRKLGYVTLLFPTFGFSTLGVHWLYAGSGNVQARNSDGDALGRDLGMNNHDIAIVFAKRFERSLSLGLKISYLHSTFAEMTAYSVGFDFGAMISVSYTHLRAHET